MPFGGSAKSEFLHCLHDGIQRVLILLRDYRADGAFVFRQTLRQLKHFNEVSPHVWVHPELR